MHSKSKSSYNRMQKECCCFVERMRSKATQPWRQVEGNNDEVLPGRSGKAIPFSPSPPCGPHLQQQNTFNTFIKRKYMFLKLRSSQFLCVHHDSWLMWDNPHFSIFSTTQTVSNLLDFCQSDKRLDI